MTSSARNIYGDMLFYFLLVGIGDFGTSIRLTRRDVHGLLGVSPRLPTNDPLPPDLWFTQILDHFDPTRNDTWFQVSNCCHVGLSNVKYFNLMLLPFCSLQ